MIGVRIKIWQGGLGSVQKATFSNIQVIVLGYDIVGVVVEVKKQVIMAKYRSKEDDVNRILISIFVMNFPESFSAKDLFHTCKQYGHVVDSFIPSKRTKEARFQRKPLNEMGTSAKTVGENNKGGDKSSRLFGGAIGNDNSYINVLKSSNGVGRLESHSPDIVLDDECVISKELSYSLTGRVKEIDLLTNLKMALLNEGFADFSRFSKIRQASLDIIPNGRIMWVEVEGVPLKLWSMNTFRRIATKWGDLIDVFWIRAKEVPGWVSDLIEESEEEEQSDVGSLEGDNKINEDDLCGDNMDMADVPEIIFDESNGQKKDVSQDPFGIYPMLNKKTNEKIDKDHSPKYPLGFTPNEETNVNSGIGDKFVNYNVDEGTIRGDGFFVNVNSKGDDVDSVSIGRFKKSEAPRSGGSFLCLMEEVVKHGEVVIMGDFNEVRCKSDRFGSHFNVQGANVFNSFILNVGLEEVPIGEKDMSNGMRNMMGKLKFLKYKIRNWIKDKRCNRKVAFDKLKEELCLVDEAIDNGVGTEEAKIKWSIEGDENSSFFHGMLNKKRNQSNIRGIMVDGVWKEQPNNVKKEFLNHFQDRFDKPVERRVTIDMSYP
nr:hypothetical protein [Tanacetum cinerariifolium]